MGNADCGMGNADFGMRNPHFGMIGIVFWLWIGAGQVFGQESDDPFQQELIAISEKYAQKSDSALIVLDALTKKVKQDPAKLGFVYLAIGKVHHYQKQDMAQAMSFFKKGARLGESSGDCTLQISAIVHQNLGNYALGKMDVFFQTYEKAGQIYETCPASRRGLYVYSQLGINYFNRGNFQQAEIALRNADNLLEKRVPNLASHQLFAYSGLTKLAKHQQDTHKMLYYAQKAKALNLSQAHEAQVSIVSAYLGVADIFESIGLHDSAIYYLNHTRHLPIEQGSDVSLRMRMSADKELGDIYAAKGDFEKASYHKSLYVKWADSLITKTRATNLGTSLAKLENELALERKQRQLDRDRWIFIGIAALIGFILTILYLLYRNGRKLGQLNALLTVQKEELTSLNEIRTRMFAVLSHDLVSPLGALQNMVELSQQGFFSEADFAEYAQSLKQQVEALLKTIQNIVVWAHTQLSGKKPFIESLPFHALVQEQFDLQHGAAGQKKIFLENQVPTDFTILADYNQMSLVIRNLLDNSIKYSNKGGRVTVSAWVTPTQTHLRIQDTGIGMCEEQIAQLFQPKTKKVNLGLQMVHDFVKTNGYTLTVESKRNEGTQFNLYLKK